jgi:acyl-coenzyme A synthetase/AMP-(fatty) acid ligase
MIDMDGNLIITGRAKDLIKSGGEWINPAEIEAMVGALPQRPLAAVIGRQDVKWGERPVLLVEMRDGIGLVGFVHGLKAADAMEGRLGARDHVRRRGQDPLRSRRWAGGRRVAPARASLARRRWRRYGPTCAS